MCTDKGIKLTVNLVRYQEYPASSLDHFNWRPRVKLDLDLHRAETTLMVQWSLRSPKGDMITQTKSARDGSTIETYPLDMEEVIHVPDQTK
jgi:hypothetical protein